MDKSILRKLQLTELEILKVVHEFCISHDIKYSLYAGTGIGAVRHGGFIPWDDDIDIVMTRHYYNIFVKKWNENPVEDYFLQNSYTENNINFDHSKIRKNNTVLLSEGDELNEGHQGVWIDIFVWDKIPDRKLSHKKMIFYAYLRNVFNRGNRVRSNDSLKKMVVKKFLRLIPSKIRSSQVKKINKIIQSYKDMKIDYHWVDFSVASCFDVLFPPEIVKQYISIKFEGYSFMIFKDYDEMLKLEYGNYMQLPPKDEQVCKHNPIRIML